MKARLRLAKSINEMVSEYFFLRSQKKVIDDKMKGLASTIKEYAKENGVKNDTGSYYCQNDEYIFGSQAKKSVSFDVDKAVEFLKSRGFNHAVKQITTYEIDEDVVESLVGSGDISLSDLESITNTKVTYSVDVKKKEEVTDVEQHYAVAASRRGKKQ